MDLRTIKDVEVVSTGTYDLGSGKTTFTAEDLADAVLAATDPTVVAPRIKLGHVDKRFEGDLDGEPAFGTVANMRLDNNGQTIKADLEGVPAWLADSMESAFPGRSIEGGFGFKAPSGRDYKLVVSNLALLGTTWPGVTSLDDLKQCLSANGPVLSPVEADGGGFTLKGQDGEGHVERMVMAKISAALDAEDEKEVKALMAEGRTRAQAEKIVEESSDEANEERKAKRAQAALDLGAINRRFATDIKAGKVPGSGAPGIAPQEKWWARSVQAADDGSLSLVVDDEAGHLLEVPFAVDGEAVKWSAPTLVSQDFGSLAASGDRQGPRILASWPATPGREAPKEVQTMDVDKSALAKRLGLAEDADEAAISEVLGKEPEPVAASDSKVPEGMTLVDAETWERVKGGAEQGLAVAASLVKADRDTTITAAINDGRFPVGRRAHYEGMWDRDPEGTKKLLTASAEDGGLAKGLVPVTAEIGRAGDGENDPTVEASQIAAFEARYFPELAAAGGAS